MEQEIKKTKIKNINYRRFLDEGIIDLITEDDVNSILKSMKSKYLIEARSLFICLYYTGARPIEILSLRAKDIVKDGAYIAIKFTHGFKRGLPRTIHLMAKKPLVNELYSYAKSCMDEMILFYHFKNNYKRMAIGKTGKINEHIEVSDKLRYHFNKWTSNLRMGEISPYYLRHSRFSKWSEIGLSDGQLKQLKGSRTYQSIEPYRHMSTFSSKSAARKTV